MNHPHPIPARFPAIALVACAVTLLGVLSTPVKAIPQANSPVAPAVLDRVVAVVNNHAILASDLDDEIRLSVLDPSQGALGALTRTRALDQLIARALIEQQIGEEAAQSDVPTQAQVDARLEEIRKELPACVRLNCASEDGWQAFLAAHDLTQPRVETYLRSRIEILRFIEMRFRQGISISPPEVADYYRNTLLPQYPKGEPAPPLDQVSTRIEEILLQQRVNVLFDDWLSNLRNQGEIEVLDPSLESPTLKAPVLAVPVGSSSPPRGAKPPLHPLSSGGSQ